MSVAIMIQEPVNQMGDLLIRSPPPNPMAKRQTLVTIPTFL